jgi:hypothetical protein
MPIANWSSDSAFSDAEYLDLPAEWGSFVERYLNVLDGRAPMSGVLEVVADSAPSRVLVERDYIDRDYRDEFANFYAQTFRHIPDRCQRLHFLDAESNRYYGFSVMRPIIGRPVCRTLLAPPPSLERFVSCTARSQPAPYGYRFTVDGFPFISQDYQYGVCAHAAIWMVAHYFHLGFRLPRYQISDIVRAASAHPEIDRAVPSTGLTHRQISAVLQDFGMPAISYVLDEKGAPEGLPDETVETIACRYLNSGLPVMLLSQSHAKVLIGYGREKGSDELFFVCHDDAKGPYRAIQGIKSLADPLGTEDSSGAGDRRLVAPLPGRIYLAGEAAERAARSFFRSQLNDRTELDDQRKLFEQGNLRLRTYVTEIASYRRLLRSRGLPPGIAGLHARMIASHWIWVTELQDCRLADEGKSCVIGELVVDSTSDDRTPHLLFANLPGILMSWPEINSPGIGVKTEPYPPYETGCKIHIP